MPFIFCICVRTFFSRHKNDFYKILETEMRREKNEI